MNTQEIARWLISNPQQWGRIVELIAEQNLDYVRQLAEVFEGQLWIDFLHDCLNQYEEK